MKIRRIKNTAEKFRNRIAKMQTDNRGLTLIELIITVAIIAIFSGVLYKLTHQPVMASTK